MTPFSTNKPRNTFYMTTVIRSLKTQPFENRFRSASFLKRFCYSLINVRHPPPPPPPFVKMVTSCMLRVYLVFLYKVTSPTTGLA